MDTINTLYKAFCKAYKVTTDSRKIEQNAVFFALRGEHFDGNDFALQVAEEGVASLVVCDRDDIPAHPRILKVNNSLKALQDLARHHRLQMKARVLAITGTNGKTTTKELIAAVLSKKHNIIYTQGNLNNHIGVPLTLLTIKPETKFAIVEMGANHPGEIDALANIACPDCGLITNIGKAHLEGFGNFEGIVNTKTELYRYIKDNGGFVFVNRDNKLLWELSEIVPRITYGDHYDADYRVEPLESNPYLSVLCDSHKIQTQLVGNYNFENVAAAIGVGVHFGVSRPMVYEALKEYRPTNSRSQVIESGKNHIIMDAYNANPTSMQASVRNFRNICGANHLLILGDMRELGTDSEIEHKTILNLLNELEYKAAYLVGPNFKAYNHDPRWIAFEDVESLCQFLALHPVEGKDILVKGSRGIRLEKVLPLI